MTTKQKIDGLIQDTFGDRFLLNIKANKLIDVVDSLTFIHILVMLEVAFNVEIPDDKLTLSSFETLENIYEIFEEKEVSSDASHD